MIALSVLFYVLCLAAFARVRRMTRIHKRVVDPLLVFVGFEVISVWPATVYAQATGDSDFYPVLIAAAGFLAFLTGFMLSSMSLLPRLMKGRAARRPEDLPQVYPEVFYRVMIVAAGFATLGLSLAFYRGIPPFLRALQTLASGGGYDDAVTQLSLQRTALTKGFYFGAEYRGQGVMLQLIQVGWTYLLVLSIVAYRRFRTKPWLVVSLLVGTLTVAFVGGTGERWPLVISMVGAVIAVSLSGGLRLRSGVIWGSVITAVFVLISTLNTSSVLAVREQNPVLGVAGEGFYRILVGNGIHDVQIINLVRDGHLELGHGEVHIGKVRQALPGVGTEVPFARRVLGLIQPGTSATTFASPTNLGVTYADFGQLSVLVFLLLGYGVGVVQWLILKPKRDLSGLAIAVSVTLAFSDLAVGSTVSFAVGVGTVLIFANACRFLLFLQTPVLRDRPTRGTQMRWEAR